MDRREAMLRELNLYPLWVRQEPPAPCAAQDAISVAVSEPAAKMNAPAPDEQGDTVFSAASTAMTTGHRAGDESLREFQLKHAGGSLARLDWHELEQKARDCELCPLRAGCTQTVFGVGGMQSDWLFIGEAPGCEEDVQGEPFVGPAGRLLDNMLMAIKLKRGDNVYITNVVKCRPADDRHPHVGEIAACFPYLQRQIELIKPKVIVTLGKTAVSALLGTDATLGSLRGTLHDYRGIPLIATYHPAYLLRSPMEKARAWQDLRLAVAAMQEASSRSGMLSGAS
jgi:DNA polymerase